MSWCPKCNKTHADDIGSNNAATCLECGEQLIPGIPDDYTEIISGGEEEFSLTAFNILFENDFTDTHYYIDEAGGYHVFTGSSHADEAISLTYGEPYKNFKDDISESASSSAPDTFVTYTKKSEVYNDCISSTISLLVVGIPGLLSTLADMFGLIRFSFSGFGFDISMIIIFSAFILGGIHALYKAIKTKPLVAQEEKLTQDIKTYMNENFISPENPEDSDLSFIYYTRCSAMKQMIIDEFKIDDDAYLDYIIEDLYSEYFDDK